MFTTTAKLQNSDASPARVSHLERGLMKAFGSVYNKDMLFPVFLIAQINGTDDYFWVKQQTTTHVELSGVSNAVNAADFSKAGVFTYNMSDEAVRATVKAWTDVYVAAFETVHGGMNVPPNNTSNWWLASRPKQATAAQEMIAAQVAPAAAVQAEAWPYPKSPDTVKADAVRDASNICNDGQVCDMIGDIVVKAHAATVAGDREAIPALLLRLNVNVAEVLAALAQTNSITQEQLIAEAQPL